jgi:hypothetical protein
MASSPAGLFSQTPNMIVLKGVIPMPVVHSLSTSDLFQYQVLTAEGPALVQVIGPNAGALAAALEASLAKPELGIEAAFRLDTLPQAL